MVNPFVARGSASVITVVIGSANTGGRARFSNWSKRPQGQISKAWPEIMSDYHCQRYRRSPPWTTSSAPTASGPVEIMTNSTSEAS